MSRNAFGWFCLGSVLILHFVPGLAFAYDFETRANELTGNLIGTLMPILSTLGLVYAAALAVSGDEGAKKKIITVIVCSIIGFLAPHLIYWLKAASGS